MRTIAACLLIGIISFSVSAQVKIGQNPETIHPASILELEDDSKALVLTRISDANMNTMTPLRGALVYNTDLECVFYYSGTTWQNLCSAGGTSNESLVIEDNELVLTDSNGDQVSVTLETISEQTFTADPIQNFRETILITQTGNNFNFEVLEITGEQIADFTIQGIDIAEETIRSSNLATNSVGQSELSENSVADSEIDYSQVTLNDFTNDAGFITSAQTISTDLGNDIIDSNGAFYDDSSLQTAIDTNTANLSEHLAEDNDIDSTNELVTEFRLDGTNLIISEGANTRSVGLDALGGGGSDDQNLTNATLNGANQLTIEIEDGDPVSVDLSSLAGGAADGSETRVTAGANTTVLGTGTIVDPYIISATVTGGGTDGVINDVELLGNDLNFTGANGGFTGTVDLSTLAGGGGADGVINNVALNGTDLEFTASPDGGFTGVIPLGALGSTEVADQTTITGVGTAGDPFKVEPGPNGQFLTTTGGAVAWANLPGGTGGTVATDGLTIEGNGVAPDLLQVADGGITPLQLNDMGATVRQVLKFDGTNWGPDNDRAIFNILFDFQDNPTSGNRELFMRDNEGNEVSVDVSTLQAEIGTGGTGGTDNQNLTNATLDANSLLTIEIEDGDPVTADLSALVSGGSASLVTIGGNDFVRIEGADGSEFFIGTGINVSFVGTGTDADPLLIQSTDIDFDRQNLATDGNPGNISIDNGQGVQLNEITLNVDDADADPTNEIELPDDAGAAAGDILSTDGTGTGTYAWISPAAGSTDDQLLGLTATELVLEDGGSVLLDAIDNQTAEEVGFTPILPSNDNNTVQDAIASLQTQVDAFADTDEQQLTIEAGNLLTLEDGGAPIDLTPFLDNQTAAEVDFTATGNTVSNTVQAAIEEIQTEVDGLATGSSNLSNTNLTQTAATNREYDINNGNLIFTGDGSVGIGNGANLPANKFHVAGAGRFEGILNSDGVVGVPSYRFSDDTNTGIYNPAADQIGFSVGGEEALRIEEAAGNTKVFIGDDLELEGTLTDVTGSVGAADQILSSTSTGVEWIDAPDGTGTDTNTTNTSISIVANQLVIEDSDAGTIAIDLVDIKAEIDDDNQTALEVGFESTPNTTSATVQDAIEELQLDIDAMENFENTDLALGEDRTHNINNFALVFAGTGRVGIGDLGGAPESKLDVEGQIQARAGFASASGDATNPGYGFFTDNDADTGMYRAGANQLAFTTGGQRAVLIDNQQFVGINVAIPTERLHVGGNAIIEGDVNLITVNGNPPDYVFQKYFQGYSALDPDYKMPSLKEVAAFTKKYNHLPGVSSASEIMANGILVRKALFEHLEKIEELFLHTIEQQNTIESLSQENKDLKSELDSLKAEVESIKTMLNKQ